jgi:putative cardiolipin synthase
MDRGCQGRVVHAFLALIALALAGCATLPKDYPRTASTALAAPETTTIGREIAGLAGRHPGQSGFAVLRRGRIAFTTRIALADVAEKTLDVQYYIWEQDATGVLLAQHLRRAADRGVRVRVLIDDSNVVRRDASLAAFDAHPNVEVRVFNPFAQRATRVVGFLTDFNRLNHRMHNKLIVVDNAVAIVGGRNMSDPYFEVDPEFNFRDLDVVAAGPITKELSAVFDRFWNGEWSVPIAALVDRAYTVDELDTPARRERIATIVATYPHPLSHDLASVKAAVSQITAMLVWAPGRVLFDDPASIEDPGLRVMGRTLRKRTDEASREILIEAAYFIPFQEGAALAKQLVDRGVRVRVVTNSLTSNDVIQAFAGYSISRVDLIRAGVELHELRFEPGPARKRQLPAGSKASLHTKTIVFDRKDVFIGSFNLDARSSSINTEAGLYIESPELAAQVIEYLDEGAGPEVSYRVELDAAGNLQWTASDDGKVLRYDRDPLSTPGQRARAGFWSVLPILDQL